MLAWHELNGAFSRNRNELVFGNSVPHLCSPVSALSSKSCYVFLLSENMASPHCVHKFRPIYGDLYWPTTWRSLLFLDMDSQVVDLTWKIAHGVLYTAECLSSLSLSLSTVCFCGAPMESLQHLFFLCLLAQSVLSWLQSLMFSFSHMSFWF